MKPLNLNNNIKLSGRPKTKKLIKIGADWVPINRINLKKVVTAYLLMTGGPVTDENINEIIKEF